MEGLLTRKPNFICLIGINIYGHPFMYRSVYAMLLLYIFFSTAPAYAEERIIFTDVDLERYNARPMVDQESISRSEADLNSYLNKRSAELQRDEKTRRQSEEANKHVLQKKKTLVTQVPITVQRTPRRS